MVDYLCFLKYPAKANFVRRDLYYGERNLALIVVSCRQSGDTSVSAVMPSITSRSIMRVDLSNLLKLNRHFSHDTLFCLVKALNFSKSRESMSRIARRISKIEKDITRVMHMPCFETWNFGKFYFQVSC